MDRYFVGVDLDQSRDFTALAVVERAVGSGEWDPVMATWPKVVTLNLRFLGRMEMGTPYPEVVDRGGADDALRGAGTQAQPATGRAARPIRQMHPTDCIHGD